MLADIHEERGDAAGARLLLRRAVSALRAQQSAGVLLNPSTMGNLAASLREDGDLDLALELAEAALALSRERDEDPVSLGIHLRTLAGVHETRGQLAAADTRLQEAIALVREVPGSGQRLLAALL